MALLDWIVVQPINGRTDWYTLAAFDSQADADAFAQHLDDRDPGREFNHEVRFVGTR